MNYKTWKMENNKFHIHKLNNINNLTKCGISAKNRLMILLDEVYSLNVLKSDKTICKKCLHILEIENEKRMEIWRNDMENVIDKEKLQKALVGIKKRKEKRLKLKKEKIYKSLHQEKKEDLNRIDYNDPCVRCGMMCGTMYSCAHCRQLRSYY